MVIGNIGIGNNLTLATFNFYTLPKSLQGNLFSPTGKPVCPYREHRLPLQGKSFAPTGKVVCPYRESRLPLQGTSLAPSEEKT